MHSEQSKVDLPEGAVLVSSEIIVRQPCIHSCAECGIDTVHPGIFCEVCSDSLDVSGRQVVSMS